MTTRRFAATALVLARLGPLAGCEETGKQCPACPSGTRCNPATATCVTYDNRCPAPPASCGEGATCTAEGVCACVAGRADCNRDLALPGGNGCECLSCAGSVCGASTCDANTPQGCGGELAFCDGVTCTPCPEGSFNCDGIGFCEAINSCNTCDPQAKDACGDARHYCDGQACLACEAETHNCDGVGYCESTAPCAGCDAEQAFSCAGTGQFCDSGSCTPCPEGSYNCDGKGFCESNKPC